MLGCNPQPSQPIIHNWIKSLVGTLHEDPELKTLCPHIPIVTRQPPSVASMALKSMHWLGTAGPGPSQHSPGCHRLHPQRSCVCCARIEERTTMVKSTMTNREYNIRRHYNCQSTWVVYVVPARSSTLARRSRPWWPGTIATDQR